MYWTFTGVILSSDSEYMAWVMGITKVIGFTRNLAYRSEADETARCVTGTLKYHAVVTSILWIDVFIVLVQSELDFLNLTAHCLFVFYYVSLLTVVIWYIVYKSNFY